MSRTDTKLRAVCTAQLELSKFAEEFSNCVSTVEPKKGRWILLDLECGQLFIILISSFCGNEQSKMWTIILDKSGNKLYFETRCAGAGVTI